MKPLISPETGQPIYCERCEQNYAVKEVHYEDPNYPDSPDAWDQICESSYAQIATAEEAKGEN